MSVRGARAVEAVASAILITASAAGLTAVFFGGIAADPDSVLQPQLFPAISIGVVLVLSLLQLSRMLLLKQSDLVGEPAVTADQMQFLIGAYAILVLAHFLMSFVGFVPAGIFVMLAFARLAGVPASLAMASICIAAPTTIFALVRLLLSPAFP